MKMRIKKSNSLLFRLILAFIRRKYLCANVRSLCVRAFKWWHCRRTMCTITHSMDGVSLELIMDKYIHWIWTDSAKRDARRCCHRNFAMTFFLLLFGIIAYLLDFIYHRLMTCGCVRANAEQKKTGPVKWSNNSIWLNISQAFAG